VSNESHCAQFGKTIGLDPLFNLLTLKNLPFGYANSDSFQGTMGIFRYFGCGLVFSFFFFFFLFLSSSDVLFSSLMK